MVLRAVVHLYVVAAEPVGSRSIVKRLNLNISPATVRNVMADLEEGGFVRRLHTSSGRVPTDKGYRYYVDYLMRKHELMPEERQRIESEVSEKLNDIDAIIRQTCRLLALVSRHTGIVEAPHDDRAEIRRIELMPMGADRVVLLIVDNLGRVRTSSMFVEEQNRIDIDDLGRLTSFLNEQLAGVTLDRLSEEVDACIDALWNRQQHLAQSVEQLFVAVSRLYPSQVFLDGAAQLFEQPEFNEMSSARAVLGLLDERRRLSELLHGVSVKHRPSRASVLIGSETHDEGFSEISVVVSPYCIGHETVGMLGVLGPRRMHYSRLTAIVDYTAGILSRSLTRLAG